LTFVEHGVSLSEEKVVEKSEKFRSWQVNFDRQATEISAGGEDSGDENPQPMPSWVRGDVAGDSEAAGVMALRLPGTILPPNSRIMA
jgi:hypothetical protein